MGKPKSTFKGSKGGGHGPKGVSSMSKKTFKKKTPSVRKKSSTSTKKQKAVKVRGEKRTAAAVEASSGLEDKTLKKPKVSAAVMATKKERRNYRKQKQGDFELVRESKVIWEHLRPRKQTPGKSLAREEIMAFAQGHFKQLALKHDTARVVQSCLKSGTVQHRTAVFSELRDEIVELSKLKYSKFVVKALLKYCSATERAEVISSLYGHIRRLIRHSEAGEIVELAYNEFANGKQRTALVQEFYGTEFALFKNTLPQGMEDHTHLPESLGDILAACPSKRKGILMHMKDSLVPLLNKSVLRHSIVHRALLDYLLHCTPEARSVRDYLVSSGKEMVESLREKVVNILHTKDGSRVALHCVWHGSTRDRKIIVKSLKSLVCKVCREENGHLVMMAIFDCVDDTVLVKKVLLAELNRNLQEVCEDQYGRRVVLYLLSPRSPRHFSSQFVALLSPGDANAHSKKPIEVRRRELLEGVASSLLAVASANALVWAQTSQHAPLLLEIATSLSGDLSPLYEPLLECLRTCASEESSEGEGQLIEHPCAHWVIKKLITIDRQKVKQDDKDESASFASKLVSCVGPEQICSWATSSNRGAFVVSALLEGGGVLAGKVARMLRPLAWSLGQSSLQGQQALYTHL